ncbi:hypothetical protein JCM19294_1738 [Nonlabens tegetincola]|uniref:Lipoprotein n=1 Tax=Nonlabens tegetincola TaxID=323273 RepID=A0A090PZM1_9FLAO|nr:hypothetical protein [Nonlabens tegetincola]GAK96225.1 hypothetical protein JCM19294_1738 [Nonlabens tegetincola]
MKKLYYLFAIVLLAASCSQVEDANALEGQNDQIEIAKLSEQEFIDHVENIALADNLISQHINPEQSVSPVPYEAMTTQVEEGKFGIIGGSNSGACFVGEALKVSNSKRYGEFTINMDSNKTYLELELNDGWYLHSIYMNVDSTCDALPRDSNNLINPCFYGIRNCFRAYTESVKYRFNNNHFGDCYCTSVYAVIYSVNEHGCVDQTHGIWVDGAEVQDQFNIRTNTHCMSDCGNGNPDN